MINDRLAMHFIAHFQNHFDANAVKWQFPNRSPMTEIDYVCAALSDFVDQRREIARSVWYAGANAQIAALFDQHLFNDSRQKIAVNVAAT